MCLIQEIKQGGSMELMLRNRNRDREILKLYEKKGLLQKQIAEKLGITTARVGQLYRRMQRERGVIGYKKPKNRVK